MGKTNRHEKTEDETINFRSKRKGKQSRKDRKSKANLQNLVSLRSQRHILNDELTIKTMEETDARIGTNEI